MLWNVFQKDMPKGGSKREKVMKAGHLGAELTQQHNILVEPITP